MLWRRKRRREQPASAKQSVRQYWEHTPTPTDALGGSNPSLGLVDDSKPAEIYPDEIDPAWADPDTAPDKSDPSASPDARGDYQRP
jgi:hypothetical protein